MAGLTGKSSPHDLYTPPPAASPAPVAPVSPVPTFPKAAQAGTPQKPQFDLSSLLKGFGQPQAPQGPMTNTSTANPTITKINESQMKDFEGDMRAGVLGDQAAGKVRDDFENEKKAAANEAMRRGGVVDPTMQAGLSRDLARNQVGARVGITNDAEARRASLGGQIAGQAALDENLQNQQRVTAMNQQAQYAQQQNTARQTELSNIRNIIDLFGENDLFSGAAPAAAPAAPAYNPNGWASA